MKLEQTVAEVAALVRGVVTGPSGRRLVALRSLEEAGPDDLAAVFRAEYVPAARNSRAGCLLLNETLELPARDDQSLVRVPDPELAVDTLVATAGPRDRGPEAGVHPTAIVDPGAEVDASAGVGPWVYVGRGARVGPGVRLWARVFVGEEAAVGAGSQLYPGVYLGTRCTVGERVVLHAGVAIGGDGFGFRRDRKGEHAKSPQVGVVRIGDDVEIGANSTVDRARLEATVVGNGVKLDDQVHIGHNSIVGDHTVIAGQTALAGGVRIGTHVQVGGHVGIAGEVRVADGSIIGAHSLVMKDIAEGEFQMGLPAVLTGDGSARS